MSIYSGRCDLCDWLYDYSEEKLQNTTIILTDGTVINPKEQRDVIPYYPFIVSAGSTSNGITRIYLSSMSYVDQSEQESLRFADRNGKIIYNRLVREGKPISAETIYNGIDYFKMNPELMTVAQRIIEHPHSKYHTKGIRLSTYDRLYREALYVDMIAHGYDEEYTKHWVYEGGNKCEIRKDWMQLILES